MFLVQKYVDHAEELDLTMFIDAYVDVTTLIKKMGDEAGVDHKTMICKPGKRTATSSLPHKNNNWKKSLAKITLTTADNLAAAPEAAPVMGPQNETVSSAHIFKAKALGSKWEKLGDSPPGSGHELTNPKLAFALKRRMEFTATDLKVFELENLQPTDFIKSGVSYFKPGARKSWVF